MFWLSILLFFILTISFIVTYIIDPIGNLIVKNVTELDTTQIKNVSEQYISDLGIKIEKPIVYRFVEFKPSNKKDEILLGTFHAWNGKYYIDINAETASDNKTFLVTVKHETRHMIVAELQEKKIINLMKYTEEIAQEQNTYYNNLFDSGVYLLKTQQNQKGE